MRNAIEAWTKSLAALIAEKSFLEKAAPFAVGVGVGLVALVLVNFTVG